MHPRLERIPPENGSFRMGLCSKSLSYLMLGIALASLGPSPAAANEAAVPEPRRVPRVEGAVDVDGRLDEAFWKDALLMDIPLEVKPGENIPAPVRTEVLLAYNGSHFLAAFRAYDPEPGNIRAHLGDHDGVGSDDWVGLVLDTFNEKRRSFDFIVNPLGVQADLVECETCTNGNAWDAIWDSAGRIEDFGYVVEMAIPFSSLRFQRSEGDQVWRIDALRSWPRSVDHRMGIFPRDRGNNCYLCQAVEIVGFAGASPGRNVELDPTFTSILTQARTSYPDGPFEGDDPTADPGLTARWGITPNLTLNGAVNPDFSQVEADAAQLDINTTFALYYPEKRPFFLEGADYFETPLRVVHTRSLADPDWGAKLTGKEGRGTIGFFSAQDATTNLIFPGLYASQSTSLDRESYGAVARYKRDVRSSSSVGALATGRFGEDYANVAGGVDGMLKFTKTEQLQFQVLGSSTEYPAAVAEEFGQPAGGFQGFAAHGLYMHDTERWDWYGYFEEEHENFRADLGFMPKVGGRFGEVGLTRTWDGDATKWFSQINLSASFDQLWERDWDFVHSGLNWWVDYQGPLQTTIDLQGEVFATKRYNGAEYEYDSFIFGAQTLPRSWIELFVQGYYADNIDYVNERQGKALRVGPGGVFKLGRHLSAQIDHTYSRLDVAAGRLFTANISQMKLVYQLDRRTFLRAIVQYVDYHREAGLYVVDVPANETQALTQLLFSYKVNPQTVLYLGYSDSYYGLDEIDPVRTDRTFFAKIGYAWVI